MKAAHTNTDLHQALIDAYPEIELVLNASEGLPVYAVGGAVRDLVLGRGRRDLDIVVEGDPFPMAARLDTGRIEHRRFGTAGLKLGDLHLDLVQARREVYPEPGALPEVEPAGIQEDLGRRDFSINAMAVRMDRAPGVDRRVIDPYGGLVALREGLINVLHRRSFVDDPTRVFRAAKYAARYSFHIEPSTLELIEQAAANSVSRDRILSELRAIAAEETAIEAFALLDKWGFWSQHHGALDLAMKVKGLLDEEPWRGSCERQESILKVLDVPGGPAFEIPMTPPPSRSEAAEAAIGLEPEELVIARARGAEWLDEYMTDLRHIRLEIGGDDLLAAGVPQGPMIGRALRTAWRAKLDEGISGREAELKTALAAVNGCEQS